MVFLRALKRWRSKWPSQKRSGIRDSLRREFAAGVLGQLYVDLGSHERNTVFLAGTARSGTTWVSSLINYRNEYRFIHEPMRRDRLRVTGVFRPRQYLRAGDRDPRYRNAMQAIVRGRIRSIWVDKYNRKVFPKKRLVRDVRSNLLLPWIHGTFPEMRMVLLLRHPCAVAHSQMKFGEGWPIDLSRFLAEPELMEDVLAPHREQIEAAASKFEEHIFAWCIENIVPLRMLPEGEIHVAYYEKFVTEPLDELTRLFAFLGSEVGDDILQVLQKPSHSTRKDSAVVRAENPVDSWKNAIGPDRSERAMEILGYFGLDRIYGADGLPRVGEEAALRFPLPQGHADAPPANDAGPG
jgi:hypothetical protein